MNVLYSITLLRIIYTVATGIWSIISISKWFIGCWHYIMFNRSVPVCQCEESQTLDVRQISLYRVFPWIWTRYLGYRMDFSDFVCIYLLKSVIAKYENSLIMMKFNKWCIINIYWNLMQLNDKCISRSGNERGRQSSLLIFNNNVHKTYTFRNLK